MIIIDQKIKLDDLQHFYESCYRFLDISYFPRIEIIKTRPRAEKVNKFYRKSDIFYMLCLFILFVAKCTHRKKGIKNLLRIQSSFISSAPDIKHFQIEHKRYKNLDVFLFFEIIVCFK